MSRPVLIIEDEQDIARSLQYNLEQEGFRALISGDGESGLATAIADPPALVILDLNLPGMSGLDVCKKLRAAQGTATVPIIMLTARVEENDRVRGLDLGADDYVTKPFSLREVMARVRALMRRSTPGGHDQPLVAGPLTVDPGSRRVHVDGDEVQLTRREFDLLADLMAHPNHVRTRELLLQRVWDYAHTGGTRTVDVHVRNLRKKLGPSAGGLIETVVGVGYRFRN